MYRRLVKNTYVGRSNRGGLRAPAFGGRSAIYTYLRNEKNKRVSLRNVEEGLAMSHSYTLMREKKPISTHNMYYVYTKRALLQADLCYAPFPLKNDGIKYWLTCIDVYTRFLVVRPLKTKTAAETCSALRSIVREFGEIRRGKTRLMTDAAAEFQNNSVKQMLLEEGVRHELYSFRKLAYIERVHRSLQKLVYSFLAENETERYIHRLQEIVKLYLHRKHRMLSCTPAQAETREYQEVVQRSMEKHRMKNLSKRRKPKFNLGELVRVILEKGKVTNRGYTRNFGYKIYKIIGINNYLPIPTYTLESFEDEIPQHGTYYASELQLVVPDPREGWRVREVLDERGRGRNRELHVLFVGFNTPQWVRAANVTRRF